MFTNDLTPTILKALLFCRSPEGFWGLPILLWGKCGVGKTAGVSATAKNCGLYPYRLAPSERGEGQFGVVPVPGADGRLHYPPPDWTDQVDARPSLLFVDEIDSVPMALQAPLLGMVQLRTVGSHTLARTTRVIGAANGVAGTWDLREDLLNRFGHFTFSGFGADEWAQGLLSRFTLGDGGTPTDAETLQATVLERWPAAEARAVGMISAFISRRPELLDKRPAKGSKDRAFPTPRTCEYAAVALASAYVHGLDESDTDTLMAGFVGLAWVTEFRSWLQHADLPDPGAFLDRKAQFTHDPLRLDRTLALLSACTALVIPEHAPNRLPRVDTLWGFMGGLIDTAADIVIPPARVLVRARLIATKSYTGEGGVGHKLAKVMQAAGMLG